MTVEMTTKRVGRREEVGGDWLEQVHPSRPTPPITTRQYPPAYRRATAGFTIGASGEGHPKSERHDGLQLDRSGGRNGGDDDRGRGRLGVLGVDLDAEIEPSLLRPSLAQRAALAPAAAAWLCRRLCRSSC